MHSYHRWSFSFSCYKICLKNIAAIPPLKCCNLGNFLQEKRKHCSNQHVYQLCSSLTNVKVATRAGVIKLLLALAGIFIGC